MNRPLVGELEGGKYGRDGVESVLENLLEILGAGLLDVGCIDGVVHVPHRVDVPKPDLHVSRELAHWCNEDRWRG